jgi:hypothetical protein
VHHVRIFEVVDDSPALAASAPLTDGLNPHPNVAGGGHNGRGSGRAFRPTVDEQGMFEFDVDV